MSQSQSIIFCGIENGNQSNKEDSTLVKRLILIFFLVVMVAELFVIGAIAIHALMTEVNINIYHSVLHI